MPNIIEKVDSLRSVDLQQILRTFGSNYVGKKKDLRDRVVTLIGNLEQPNSAVSYKIDEVYTRISSRNRRGESESSEAPATDLAAVAEPSPPPRGRSQRSAAIVARNQMAATAALAYDLPHTRRERDIVALPQECHAPTPTRLPKNADSSEKKSVASDKKAEMDVRLVNGVSGKTSSGSSKSVVRLATIESYFSNAPSRTTSLASGSAQSSNASTSAFTPVAPQPGTLWESAYVSSVSDAARRLNDSVTISHVSFAQQRASTNGSGIATVSISPVAPCNWTPGDVDSSASTVQISKTVVSGAPKPCPSSDGYPYQNARSRVPYPAISVPLAPDVKMEELPFFPVLDCLMKPMTLVPSSPSAGAERSAKFSFILTPQQSQSITANLVRSPSGLTRAGTQIQLRFSKMETSCPQKDFFPPNLTVLVNNSSVELPKLIHSTQAGIPPKRPPAPLDITAHRSYSHSRPNYVTVTWSIDSGTPENAGTQYTASVWLVKQLTAQDLIKQLKSKGPKDADYTRAMIKEKLRNDEDEVAMTFLRVSLACPLGKCRMQLPCRSSGDCTHLQCFDANFFICMNERRPSWMCPVCDKEIPFKSLVLDGYFMDVLKSNPPEDMIELHLDGSWSLPGQKAHNNVSNEKLSIDVPSPTDSCHSDGVYVVDVKEGKADKPPKPPSAVLEVDLVSSDEDESSSSSSSSSDSADSDVTADPALSVSASSASENNAPAGSADSLLDLSRSRKRSSACSNSGNESDSSVGASPKRLRVSKVRRISSSSDDSSPEIVTPFVAKSDEPVGDEAPPPPLAITGHVSCEIIDLSSDED